MATDLADMLEDIQSRDSDLSAPGPVQKLNYSHLAMIDYIIAHPGVSQNELARVFGYKPSWISRVMTSDAFQAAHAARVVEVVDPLLKDQVQARMRGLANRAYEVLEEKLDRPARDIPDMLAIRSAEIAQRALGYGAREQTVAVQINMETHLGDLSQNLTKLLVRRKEELNPEIERLTIDQPEAKK